MDCIFWGASGQAKVVRPILANLGLDLLGIFDANRNAVNPFSDVPFMGDWEQFELIVSRLIDMRFVVTLGGARGRDRCDVSERLSRMGLVSVTLIHQSSWVAKSAIIGEGCQILAMSAISEEVVIGADVIINTSASVDHECQLGRGVHVMPGAVLAGCIVVGDYATIGSNATILPRLSIGEGAIVGAGAVVTSNVEPYATVAGNPARPLSKAT